MKKINISTIHFQFPEQRSQENVLKQFKEATLKLAGTDVDLVVTCEGMESVGQTVDQAESFDEPGIMLDTYRDFAAENKCHIAGSVKLLEADKVYNALAFIGSDGVFLGSYKKVHLTEGELAKGMSCGTGAQVVDTSIGRLGGVICFDLNYDSLKHQYRRLKPDVLCFSSMFHGGLMQQSWAYDCRTVFAAACKDISSDIVDPLGRNISSSSFHTRITWARVNLDKFFMHGDNNSQHFPEIRRKYGNKVLIDAVSHLGTAVLYSEDESVSAKQIADEFGLTAIDDYLDQF
jgi:hypothetical protein